ncbi:thymidylate synthase [Priestia sp. SB1]|uniref:thymidylate synthase n=1 Tax=Priestia sp. SB1 TaxID=3132359 RepID=UPI003171C976
MSKFDIQYNALAEEIINNGVLDDDQIVRTKWKDGSPAYTKALLNKRFVFDDSEVPVLTTKRVAWKTAIKEILWIWQLKSNDVNDLRKLNGTDKTVWNEWENKKTNTIGFAYGYQMGKKCRKVQVKGTEHLENFCYHDFDQVDYLLYQLKNNPSSRRLITSLWNIDDLDYMNLEPCVWNTHWQVQKGKLHLTVNARSNDFMLGNPFNILQYYILGKMLAQVSNLEFGTMTFNMDNVHAYDRHLDVLKEQIQRETYEAPKLWINPEIKNFYDFTIDDIKLIDYKHGESLNVEVAI